MNYKINLFLYIFSPNFYDSQFLMMQGSLTKIHRELCEASKAFSSFHEIEIRKGLQRLRNATLNRASKQQQENALVSVGDTFLNQQQQKIMICFRITQAKFNCLII
jgi:hypothetical protein